MKAPSESGFTLAELLISLLIFGMLTAAGVALLSFSVRAQDASDARLSELAELRRAGALLTADLAQASPRLARDGGGVARIAFQGGSGEEGFTLVRRGWTNHDGSARPTIQKVSYRLAGDRLERIAYLHPDGAQANEPLTLIDEVASLRLRYRAEDGSWRERWDPLRSDELPLAVEMVVETADEGSVRQLFLVRTART